MDQILKPEYAFRKFYCINEFNDKLDVRMLARNLQQGTYVSGGDGYYLAQRDYYKKHYYDRIPRWARFSVSEKEFCSFRFDFDCWYDYDTDLNEIYKEYCETFIQMGGSSKMVNNFYKKLQKEHPELFI